MCFPTKKFYHKCLSEQTSHLESQCSCTVLLMDMFLMVPASSEVFPLFLWRHLALHDYYNVTLFYFGLLSTVHFVTCDFAQPGAYWEDPLFYNCINTLPWAVGQWCKSLCLPLRVLGGNCSLKAHYAAEWYMYHIRRCVLPLTPLGWVWHGLSPGRSKGRWFSAGLVELVLDRCPGHHREYSRGGFGEKDEQEQHQSLWGVAGCPDQVSPPG